MEQWNEREQLLAAKLEEIRKRPGNLLTGLASVNYYVTENCSCFYCLHRAVRLTFQQVKDMQMTC